MAARAATFLVLVLCAAALAALGRWGSTSAGRLAPTHFEQEDRERRTGVVRRGAAACYLGAAAMAVVAVLAVL